MNHQAFAPVFFQGEIVSNGGIPPISTFYSVSFFSDPQYSKRSEELFGQIVDFQGNAVYSSQLNVQDRFTFSDLLKAANVKYEGKKFSLN